MKARVIIIDTGASLQALNKNTNLSPGLALNEAPDGFAIAYNQAPNIPANDAPPAISPFAKAFLEASTEPVTSLDEFFSILRVRVHAETDGRETPWDSNRLGIKSFAFFVSQENVPIPKSNFKIASSDSTLASLPAAEAYKTVIAKDTISGYQKFITTFPNDPSTPRIQYNLAVRREALLWAKARERNTPDAYWTYLNTYPDGVSVQEAQQDLAILGASPLPPSGFSPVVFEDLPPPLPQGEIVASSSSITYVGLPAPPVLALPPIPAAIAALSATPLAVATGNRLPRFASVAKRPVWAAPPTRAQPRSIPVSPMRAQPGRVSAPGLAPNRAPNSGGIPAQTHTQPSAGQFQRLNPEPRTNRQPGATPHQTFPAPQSSPSSPTPVPAGPIVRSPQGQQQFGRPSVPRQVPQRSAAPAKKTSAKPKPR
jgi:hypothetical protein